MRFLTLLSGLFALVLSACATTDSTSYVNPETGAVVPMASLTRGEDGVVRDQHGNVVREAQFVRNTGVVSETGASDDIFCTRERVVGTNFSRTVCMTRREVIVARQQAQDNLMGIMGNDTASAPGGPGQ